VLRYADWRAVIAEYVATRRGLDPEDLVPRVVGHVSLALSAYEQWLESTDAELAGVLNASMALLRDYLRE
jgi:TetR/AcrR family transcriptional regulator, regulator of mycofactocin system